MTVKILLKSCELADGFHFLRLPQLRLEVLPVGDVRRVAMHHPDGLDREKRPREDPVLQLRQHPQFALAGREAFLRDRARFRRQDFRGMLFAERMRHLFRGFVEIIDRAIGGEFKHRIGIELGKSRQLLNFRFRADAFQRPAAMIAQRLQRVQVRLRVGVDGVTLDGENADDGRAVADGDVHQRKRGF